jgi:hypothetical protein
VDPPQLANIHRPTESNVISFQSVKGKEENNQRTKTMDHNWPPSTNDPKDLSFHSVNCKGKEKNKEEKVLLVTPQTTK